jgi:sugar lactone lactonase YvrE
MELDAQLAVAIPARLGEGPVRDIARGVLWWMDLPAGACPLL